MTEGPLCSHCGQPESWHSPEAPCGDAHLYRELDRLKSERSAIDRKFEDIEHAEHELARQHYHLRLDAADLDRAIAEVREELGES